MSKPLHAYFMSPTERLDEVARLLALGYLRLRARRNAEKANNPNHLRSFGVTGAESRALRGWRGRGRGRATVG